MITLAGASVPLVGKMYIGMMGNGISLIYLRKRFNYGVGV